MLKAILKEIRVKQYTKNLLVFASALFAGTLLQTHVLLGTSLAFVAFSCMSSVIYVLNDIMDVERDRQHPVKCKRPIASGKLPISLAKLIAAGLLVMATFLSYLLNPALLLLLYIYLAMNLSYSLRLKHVVIVDVMIVAFGFVLRALAGVIVGAGEATSWFLLCIFLLSLFLALAKRRAELSEQGEGETRQVLAFYSVGFLDQLLGAVTAMAATAYAIFAVQGQANVYGGGQ